MGGGGGGGAGSGGGSAGGGGTPSGLGTEKDSNKLLQNATSSDQRGKYESDVNAHLQDQLSDYNDRDVETINTHINTIKEKLESDIGTIDLNFGGSLKKHTYINGLSDVDALLILNRSELSGKSPEEIKQYLYETLTERFPNTDVSVGFAITVKFSDGHKIQFLPAMRTATGVRIPSEDGADWSNVIKPEEFAQRLTTVNQSNANRVVPVIKLFKAINAKMPVDSRLTGYHAEALAVKAFEHYDGKLNYKDMLIHLCDYTSHAAFKKIEDPTGQSTHVDDYVGSEGSLQRQRISKAYERVASRLKTADSEASLEEWKQTFDGE